MAGGLCILCVECGRVGADEHTLYCTDCYLKLDPYFRHKAEHSAISVALLRQALIEAPMGGIRWSEQQLRDFLRKTQEPAANEKIRRGPKPKPLPPNTLSYELELTPMRNALDRMHFRAKRRLMDRLADAFRAQTPLASGCPYPYARIEIVRHSSSKPDVDALSGFTKPILDAMQVPSKRHPYGAGVIENDSMDSISLATRWERAPARQGKVMVYVTPGMPPRRKRAMPWGDEEDSE